MSNIGISNHIFHDNISAPSNGSEYIVNSGADDICIEFTGDAVFSAIIECRIKNNYYPLKSVNLSTLAISSTVSEINSLWQCDLGSIAGLRIRVTSITSGTLSVSGYSTN